MTVIDEIKDRLDAVEIIGETVKLRKTGKNYTGFCPFHHNTRTPAFVVFPETGTWRCFGACNDGGDIFKFVMQKEGWDFPEALARLAERAGVELRPHTEAEEAQDEVNERLRSLLETLITFYRDQMLHTPAGQKALVYLQGRDLLDQTIADFELGYAPESWDAAMNYLREKGYSPDEMTRAGVVSERDSGGCYDRFRHRVMIPIRDGRGRIAGFGARSLDKDQLPKYLNSPQNQLFDKGRILYGLDKARKEIRKQDQAVIVEGYLDVIGLYQAGFMNAVSPMGTALNEFHMRTLKRYSRRIVLALDADAAGDKGTLRGLSLARESMDREVEPVFTVKGLLRYESRLDAEIRVAALPDGVDPDELVAESREAWPALLESALPVVSYVFQVVTKDLNLEDPKVKAQVAAEMIPLIEDVSDRVEREAYRQMIARKLQIDERSLIGSSRGRLAGNLRTAQARAGQVHRFSGKRSAQEDFCLGLFLRQPELLTMINNRLRALDLEDVSPGDFMGTDRQMIASQVIEAARHQDQGLDERVWDRLDTDVAEAAAALRDAISEDELDLPQMREEALFSFLMIRQKNLKTRLDAIKFKLEQPTEDSGTVSDGEGVQQTPTRDLLKEIQTLLSGKKRLDVALAQRNGMMQDGMVSER
ncbi:MAG: DNA primase [Anaerolineales bacterium]|nr:DNA primase [Anaerolineales bacterium]